jgi:hypothetical protein
MRLPAALHFPRTTMRKLTGTAVIAAAIALLLVAAKTRSVRTPSAPKPLSGTRSFEITDKAVVAPFTLDRVLAQLIARSGVSGLTPQQLMRQLYDTQNQQPGLADPAGPHCDDTMTGGVPSFNGFPRRCPTPEGKLAATPYLADEYFAMGIANRFDLAPADGSNCGQYRIVFARREPPVPLKLIRNHLIFEAVLPNPVPSAGLIACRPVAQFWADLSSVDSMDERRARLEHFFFDGLPGFAPVIDPANFADAGGIRTLHQTLPSPGNRFYQFRLQKQCSGGDCTLRMVPDVLENMPFSELFDANATDNAQGRAFRDEFVRQLATLAIPDLAKFHMNVPRQYLMAESNPVDAFFAFDYEVPFLRAKTSPKGSAFNDRIVAELQRLGSHLDTEQLFVRTFHETCVGCHGLNGATNFGDGLTLVVGFQGLSMISEDIMMDGEAGPLTRYGVDPIIEKQFVPIRMHILEDFLRGGTPPGHSK